MNPLDIPISWFVLAALAYGAVTCSAAVLAARLRAARIRHDLIVESKRRRIEFLSATAGGEDGEGVEIEA